LSLENREKSRSVAQTVAPRSRKQPKLWKLRAAACLARLRGGQGRRAEARDPLAPVYLWFTEGFDTPDLKDARVLLTKSRAADNNDLKIAEFIL